MLIGKVGDGMFKMQVGAFFLFTGITMIVACVVVFFCCIKPYLEAAAGNGGRSMQYNVVTMSGHDDTKAWVNQMTSCGDLYLGANLKVNLMTLEL